MKHFFTLFFTLFFFNYLTANQHYTLQNSMFIAIVDANKGYEQYKKGEYTESINTFELALKNIQEYETIGIRHNKIVSHDNLGYVLSKTIANNEMVSYVKYYLYNRIGLSNVSKCQLDMEIGEKFCNEAIINFDKAIKTLALDSHKKKKYYRIYFNKAMAYFFMNMYDKAATNFKEAIKRNEHFVNAHTHLGILYGRQGMIKRNKKDKKRLLNAAKYQFNVSLKYDYENEDALNNLGEIEYILKNYKKAIENYDRAIHIDPVDPVMYANRGLAYEKQKKYSIACHNYNIAIKLYNPDRGSNEAQIYFNNLVRSGYCPPLPEIEDMIKPTEGSLRINQ